MSKNGEKRVRKFSDKDGEYKIYSSLKFPSFNTWFPVEQAAFRMSAATLNKDFLDEAQAHKNYNLSIQDYITSRNF